MKIAGVYIIRNKITGRVYVGSSYRIEFRLGQHRRALRRGKHYSLHLQRAWNCYGESAFEFEAVEVVPEPERLAEREQAWADAYKASDPIHGYNLRVITSSNLGFKRTKKSPSVFKGQKHTPEARAAMSVAKKGKPVGPALLANQVKGRILSDDTKQLLKQEMAKRWAAGVYSHVHNEDTKRKISIAKTGVPNLKMRDVPKSAYVKAAVAESNRRRAKYKTVEERRAAQRVSKARYNARLRASRSRGIPVVDGGI